MPVNLNQKERMLLEDQKQHEQLCIKKYNRYANEANNPQLKQLFHSLASVEQQHMDTLNQILSGTLPSTNQGGQGQQQGAQIGQSPGVYNQNDAELCNDLLTTEKFVAAAYNTTIFECRDTNLRQVLNHIQKEEQEHGEQLFAYMQNHGMYNVPG